MRYKVASSTVVVVEEALDATTMAFVTQVRSAAIAQMTASVNKPALCAAMVSANLARIAQAVAVPPTVVERQMAIPTTNTAAAAAIAVTRVAPPIPGSAAPQPWRHTVVEMEPARVPRMWRTAWWTAKSPVPLILTVMTASSAMDLRLALLVLARMVHL